jgi:hypothetical protein
MHLMGMCNSRTAARATSKKKGEGLMRIGWQPVPLATLLDQIGAEDSFNPYANMTPVETPDTAAFEEVWKARAEAAKEKVRAEQEQEALARADSARALAEQQRIREERSRADLERSKVEQDAMTWAASLLPRSTTLESALAKRRETERPNPAKEREREDFEARGINPDQVERMRGLELD